jgi:hypothetical protein
MFSTSISLHSVDVVCFPFRFRLRRRQRPLTSATSCLGPSLYRYRCFFSARPSLFFQHSRHALNKTENFGGNWSLSSLNTVGLFCRSPKSRGLYTDFKCSDSGDQPEKVRQPSSRYHQSQGANSIAGSPMTSLQSFVERLSKYSNRT